MLTGPGFVDVRLEMERFAREDLARDSAGAARQSNSAGRARFLQVPFGRRTLTANLSPAIRPASRIIRSFVLGDFRDSAEICTRVSATTRARNCGITMAAAADDRGAICRMRRRPAMIFAIGADHTVPVRQCNVRPVELL